MSNSVEKRMEFNTSGKSSQFTDPLKVPGHGSVSMSYCVRPASPRHIGEIRVQLSSAEKPEQSDWSTVNDFFEARRDFMILRNLSARWIRVGYESRRGRAEVVAGLVAL